MPAIIKRPSSRYTHRKITIEMTMGEYRVLYDAVMLRRRRRKGGRYITISSLLRDLIAKLADEVVEDEC